MRAALLIVLAFGLGAGAHLVGEQAGAACSVPGNPDELLHLPDGQLMRVASLGFRNLLADVLWLRAIQYYGEHRLTDRNYDQAERLFRVIHDLDPHFKGATRFGALVLAQDAHEPAAALALLRDAERVNPGDWEYPFDQGFILQTITRDYAGAGEAYQRAARLPGAPDLAARLSGMSFARLGDREAARAVWQAILAESDNELMCRIAERNLMTLATEEAEETLTQLVTAYREVRGADPRDWQDLIAAELLAAPPQEPFGGLFFLDPATGAVHSTTLLDREMARQRDVVAGVVQAQRQAEGTLPASVDEMVARGLLDAAPSRPFGVGLEYDPVTGAVAWNPPWPASEPRNQGVGSA